MKQKEFETGDLYLSSAICILLNTQPTFKVENGRTLFVFPISDNLYEAMNSYNNGIEINAYEFSLMIKRLRAEMKTLKKEITRNSNTYDAGVALRSQVLKHGVTDAILKHIKTLIENHTHDERLREFFNGLIGK